jgi:hypothetical protein
MLSTVAVGVAAAAPNEDDGDDVLTISFRDARDGCLITVQGRNLRPDYQYYIFLGDGSSSIPLITNARGGGRFSGTVLLYDESLFTYLLTDEVTPWVPGTKTVRGSCSR